MGRYKWLIVFAAVIIALVGAAYVGSSPISGDRQRPHAVSLALPSAPTTVTAGAPTGSESTPPIGQPKSDPAGAPTATTSRPVTGAQGTVTVTTATAASPFLALPVPLTAPSPSTATTGPPATTTTLPFPVQILPDPGPGTTTTTTTRPPPPPPTTTTTVTTAVPPLVGTVTITTENAEGAMGGEPIGFSADGFTPNTVYPWTCVDNASGSPYAGTLTTNASGNASLADACDVSLLSDVPVVITITFGPVTVTGPPPPQP